jgi:hypothetical protein
MTEVPICTCQRRTIWAGVLPISLCQAHEYRLLQKPPVSMTQRIPGLEEDVVGFEVAPELALLMAGMALDCHELRHDMR